MTVTMRFRIEKQSGGQWLYICEVGSRAAAIRMLRELSESEAAAIRAIDTVTGTVMTVPARYFEDA